MSGTRKTLPRGVAIKQRSASLRLAIWARTALAKEDCFTGECGTKRRRAYLPSTILASLHCAGPAVFGCGQ